MYRRPARPGRATGPVLAGPVASAATRFGRVMMADETEKREEDPT